MNQPSFLSKPRVVAETSLSAYREIAPTLPHREQLVMDALRRWPNSTAYELFRRMKSSEQATDLNSVRPRLTKLFDKGLVERGEKRACLVTGKTVLVRRLALREGE